MYEVITTTSPTPTQQKKYVGMRLLCNKLNQHHMGEFCHYRKYNKNGRPPIIAKAQHFPQQISVRVQDQQLICYNTL